MSTSDIWNEIGLVALVAVVAFAMSSFKGDMRTLVWYTHAPVSVKSVELWYIWILSEFLIMASILTVILDVENFSGDTRVNHRQLTIVAMIIIVSVVIKFFLPVSCLLDTKPNGQWYTAKEKIDLLDASVTENTTQTYFYGNKRLFVLLIHAAVLAMLAIVTLVLIVVDFNHSTSNICITVFWVVETTITLCGLGFTIHFYMVWDSESHSV